MKLGVLYSGGKDSNYTIYKALNEGHAVSLLITIIPESEESMLFHYPNVIHTKTQAECLGIPIIQKFTKNDEIQMLYQALLDAKEYNITHIASGGISSRFQKERFMNICKELDLGYYSPLWEMDQVEYMYELITKFEIMIIGVSAYGLGERWLGRIINEDALNELIVLSKRYGFNPAFEGGEAETFVLNAPHFKYRLIVEEGEKHWDGVRGRFTITSLKRVKKIF